MPIGLFALLAVSFLVFRRARAVGRSSLLWIAILWVLTFSVGFIASVLGVFSAEVMSTTGLSNTDIHANAVFSAGIGMFVGAAIAVWACGRPVPVVAEPGEFPPREDEVQ